MSDHNPNGGRGGPVIPFPQQNVPIIGQPFTLKNFFVTVQIVCNCEAKEPVLLVGHNIGTCPGCRRQFALQGIAPGPKGLQFQIGMVAAAPHEEPPPAS